MNTIMMICTVVNFIVFFGLLCTGIYLFAKPKANKKVKKKGKYVTFTKRKFNIILYHGIFWVDLSYILAFMDKAQIAETLSVQAVISIIGVFASYCIKSAYEKKIGKEKEEYEDFNAETYE